MTAVEPELTVVVNAHCEGRLAHRSLLSIQRALAPLQARGLTCETLAVLDRPDAATRSYFDQCSIVDRVERVDFGDLAEARNAGARGARGRYLTFLDADDLVSGNWFTAALTRLTGSQAGCIVHPEYTVRFGAESTLWHKVAQDAPDFPFEGLIWSNPWDAACMALRTLFLEHPYQPASTSSGWGCEDHHWHAETIAAGCLHVLAPETVLFVRRKLKGSLLQQHQTAGNVVRPSSGFDPTFLSPRISTAGKAGAPRPAQPSILRQTVSAPLRLLEYCTLGKRVARRLRNYKAKQAEALRLLFAPTRPPVQLDQLPPAVLSEWHALNLLDSAIFPDPAATVLRGTRMPWHARATQSYLELSRDAGSRVGHLFLIPWLIRGGSDLVVLNYVRTLTRLAPTSRIVVLSTENRESPWKDRLPPGVAFIEFGRRDLDLTPEIRAGILLRMLLQTAPERIHVVNSTLGFDLLIRYGRALKQISRLYASAYCPEFYPNGRRGGYALDQLPECFDHLQAIGTDNQTFIDQLCRQFGFDASRFHVHYQPVTVADSHWQDRRRSGPLQVLWAGRLDRQKRIDLLAAIAHECRDLPMHFHVYGAALLRADPSVDRLRNARNVTLHGPYDGLASLPLKDFDAFLYTSQYDGIPNVLLEAMAARLPVIASDVGGIGEVVHDGRTGWLIRPPDDVPGYVRALVALQRDRDMGHPIVAAASELLASRHSDAALAQRLLDFPGYVDADRPAVEQGHIPSDGRNAI